MDLEGKHYIGLAPEVPASEAPAENTEGEVIGALGQMSAFSEDPLCVPAPVLEISNPEENNSLVYSKPR